MQISEIRSLNYEEALKIAEETMEIKEHQVIFATCGEAFGYSALVFKDGKHIYFADDFQLHHEYMVRESGKETLRQWYIDTLNRKLFSDAELMEDIESYDEYNRKDYFLRNYYIMRHDYVSVFGIGEEEHKKIQKAKRKYPYFNPVSFCYMADESLVEIQTAISKHLNECFERLKDSSKIFREMVRRELANHEAVITCKYEDALDALGLTFEELSEEKQQIVNEELKKQIDSYNY